MNQKNDEAADKMMVLLDRATIAMKAGKPAVAAELLRQCREIAETLERKAGQS